MANRSKTHCLDEGSVIKKLSSPAYYSWNFYVKTARVFWVQKVNSHYIQVTVFVLLQGLSQREMKKVEMK